MATQVDVIPNNVEQIAFYTRDVNSTVSIFSIVEGLDNWVMDTVTAEAQVGPHLGEFRANLAFNYEMKAGMEVELIEPIEGRNYIAELGLRAGEIAHYGIHVADDVSDEEALKPFAPWGDIEEASMLMTARTVGHTNPDIPEHRRYLYHIYQVPGLKPIKLIRRLTV